jgi:hypothetical protein
MHGFYQQSRLPVNGNGHSPLNGRGIKHRNLTHDQLVGLAADSVTGVYPVVPSLSQVPAIFTGVTPRDVRAELKRRATVDKDAEAERILFQFADVWSAQSADWRASALKWIATTKDLEDVRSALTLATTK